MPKRQNPFDVKFRKRDVFACRAPKSGLTMSPVAEWSLAAQWAGYTQDYFFDKLSKRWQAHTIALYRAHGQSEAVVMQAQQEESERKAKRKHK